MDHVFLQTFFKWKREAAAHLQGWTSEHYTGSAQLYKEEYSEVTCWLTDLSSYLFESHLYRHIVQQRGELQPGLKLEDEEENDVYSWFSGYKQETLWPDK